MKIEHFQQLVAKKSVKLCTERQVTFAFHLISIPSQPQWLLCPFLGGLGWPNAKYLETLAKILHILTYSRLLVKALIKSYLFLLQTNLLIFLIGILVRVLSRVSREISWKTTIFYEILQEEAS